MRHDVLFLYTQTFCTIFCKGPSSSSALSATLMVLLHVPFYYAEPVFSISFWHSKAGLQFRLTFSNLSDKIYQTTFFFLSLHRNKFEVAIDKLLLQDEHCQSKTQPNLLTNNLAKNELFMQQLQFFSKKMCNKVVIISTRFEWDFFHVLLN